MAGIAGKRAIVTGAAQGIGAAIARRFVQEGVRVILADLDRDAVTALASELDQQAIRVDVGLREDLDRMFDLAEQQLGGLDILVNNAGMTCAAELDDLTEEAFDRVMAVNVKAAFLGIQRAARLMDRGGAIINMSSVNAELAIPNQIAYATSKGAVKQLTNVTALALAPRGIRVNAIGPGTILTEMALGIMSDDEMKQRILSRTPMGRLGLVEEIASIAVFLAGDQASYITGQTIYADGGRLGLNYTVPVLPEQMQENSA
ncbi:Short-chain dehydrogenase/reductase SDR [Sphingobium herbicidovorans NBRC 16415]|uniref:Short-chain dehydrogenase/reductase SDR n=1 Tax=Sphingobium herbicidovorans (strain ATCC 700291 / DSM 11019 / CCUG 56400 / KCTC 2939 / LMG 18315 / NBRC 16415 / MH) TaxID=1219045 RepID=A0A086PDB5_SPHHM|nr:SDR family oxidoreductase [Sphingobium herbicidovorans]KFG91383.1 Short-chain dehydrogenase/reductase SDR [Sphingobium herbicidovorans NBRC 16415]